MKKVEEFEKEYKKKMDAEKDRSQSQSVLDDYTSLVNASKEASLDSNKPLNRRMKMWKKPAKEGIVGGYLRHGR